MALSTGKLIATATGVTGVTGIATTSAVLSGGSSSTQEEVTQQPQISEEAPQVQKAPFQKPTWQHKSIPTLDKAKDIQNKYKDLPCVKDHFSEIVSWTGEGTSSDIKDSYTFPNDTNTKSCLVMENYKQSYKDNKWWGEFRLAWSIKNDDTGHGFLAAIDVKTKEGKLWGSSAAYILKKGSEGNKWNVILAKENEEHEIDDGHNALDKLIPQTSLTFRSKGWISDVRWDFDPRLYSICGQGYCSEADGDAQHKNFVWEFTVQERSAGRLDDWCENLSNWLNDNFSFGNVLSSLNTVKGNWTEKKNT